MLLGYGRQQRSHAGSLPETLMLRLDGGQRQVLLLQPEREAAVKIGLELRDMLHTEGCSILDASKEVIINGRKVGEHDVVLDIAKRRPRMPLGKLSLEIKCRRIKDANPPPRPRQENPSGDVARC